MPPGRKAPATTRDLGEAPLTEYEKLRAQNMMRNNQVLQRLGVSALASIVHNTSAKSKDDGREESGSLYLGQESEDSDQEVSKATKDARKKSSKHTANNFVRGGKTSKRVVAPEQQDEPTRVTRQKTRELPLATSPHPQQVPALNLTTAAPTPLTQQDNQIDSTDEGALTGRKDPSGLRGKSMGKDLERISRGLCAKLPIHVSEGKRRPEAPMQAAKLASEGGIILRQHMPILPRWKDYKKDESQIKNYVGKVAAQFTMDTNNNAVRDACVDLLKGGQRQMRYKLKTKYFNGVPANQVRTTSPVSTMTDDEWKALVEMWSDSKHKDKCTKNQQNREKVQFQQRTGSRCYIAHAHVAADMETIMAEPVQEGQLPRSATEVVSQVIPSSTFLKNAGIKSASKKDSRSGASSQVQELQIELEIEKQEKAELRQQIDAQRQELDTLKMQSEATTAKQSDEIESLKKTAQETNAFIRQMLSFNQSHLNPAP